ncbi:MAG: amino acid ABC transporter permease, partial [Thermosynechococcaceae cyanobacterium]
MNPTPLKPAVWQWLQRNLFSTWFNTLLTLVLFSILLQGSISFLSWATTQAQWSVISINLRLFLVGRFPLAELWRVWLSLSLAIATISLSSGVI